MITKAMFLIVGLVIASGYSMVYSQTPPQSVEAPRAREIRTTVAYCNPDISARWSLANLTFNSLYSFKINENGEVVEIKKIRDDFIGEEVIRSCLTTWRIVGIPHRSPFVVYFNWKRGKGWGEQRVSGNGFTLVMNYEGNATR